jgi:Adenylyl/Guanylyl and SMODS C-terminal sensor domain
MKKDSINVKIREYVKIKLSPNQSDRDFVTLLYESFKVVLEQSCIQIGSFPRFTAIKPIHDLDILYIIGDWDERNHSPQELLHRLQTKIITGYNNPTGYDITTSIQTHSITVSYKDKGSEIFSVDIVPAYKYSKNEFGDDTYKVPEVIMQKHGIRRIEYYQKLNEEKKEMDWISSDPRGYIEVAKDINQKNSDFRKVVKFVKAWKNACKDRDTGFSLKSFHIEQLITLNFQNKNNLEIFDGIFQFFFELPDKIETAHIEDRANDGRHIDDYINDLTRWQKDKIIKARDGFLMKLENITQDNSIEDLLDIFFYERVSHTEQFLFDFNIPTLLDDSYSFNIHGEVQEQEGGFRKFILDKTGFMPIHRKIKFRITGSSPDVDYFKWKVRNDNSSKEPRGEITDYQTRNDPENTKYKGNHYVECFAIKNNICVAKARQNVKLENGF